MTKSKFQATGNLAGNKVKALTGGARVSAGAIVEFDPSDDTVKNYVAEGLLVPYTEPKPAVPTKETVIAAKDPYDGKGLEDLQALASERNLTVEGRASKAKLVEALRAADAKPTTPPAADEAKPE